MPYLSLLSPQASPYDLPTQDDPAQAGPIFGPFPFVDVHRQERIDLGAQDTCTLRFVKGLVYYAGRFYGEWSVFDGPPLPADAGRLVPFDPSQAELLIPLITCECELPGYFHCGVPGVIAHLDNGRLAPDAKVERCYLCQRYPDDDAARLKLSELSLIWEEPGKRRYTVHVYATVRVVFRELEAVSHEATARIAEQLFDWDQHQGQAEFADEITEYLVDTDGDQHQGQAEFADEITEYLVDTDGDLGYARSRRLNGDFEEVPV